MGESSGSLLWTHPHLTQTERRRSYNVVASFLSLRQRGGEDELISVSGHIIFFPHSYARCAERWGKNGFSRFPRANLVRRKKSPSRARQEGGKIRSTLKELFRSRQKELMETSTRLFERGDSPSKGWGRMALLACEVHDSSPIPHLVLPRRGIGEESSRLLPWMRSGEGGRGRAELGDEYGQRSSLFCRLGLLFCPKEVAERCGIREGASYSPSNQWGGRLSLRFRVVLFLPQPLHAERAQVGEGRARAEFGGPSSARERPGRQERLGSRMSLDDLLPKKADEDFCNSLSDESDSSSNGWGSVLRFWLATDVSLPQPPPPIVWREGSGKRLSSSPGKGVPGGGRVRAGLGKGIGKSTASLGEMGGPLAKTGDGRSLSFYSGATASPSNG